jgi:putative flippase GtrA
MNTITELVDLPDSAVQPLVHPLDLPDARGQFRTSWLISTLTNPAVGLCIAAIIWFGSHSYVVPLIAGAAIIGFGAIASRFFRDEAWAFIPRKRQDRRRPLPRAWEFGSGLLLAAVLAVALLLVAFGLHQPDVAAGVREFTFGMAAAVGLLVAVDSLYRVRTNRGTEMGGALFILPGAVAVIASIALAYVILFGSSGPNSSTTVLLGAAAILTIGVGVGVWKYVEGRLRTEIGEPVAGLKS